MYCYTWVMLMIAAGIIEGEERLSIRHREMHERNKERQFVGVSV